MKETKKFRMIDAILAVICVVFVAEAAAPVAAIGNSQYFWWIFLMITFLLPYGLIASELGTTYDGEGGLYDWVRKAFGNKWGSRVAWYYWINYPLWMASLAVVFPEMLGSIFNTEFSLLITYLIELTFIWSLVWLSFKPICDSAWILNGAAMIKIFLALTVGVLGMYGATFHGTANELTLSSLVPSFDLDSLSYISVIIFNFLGFEVICSFAPSMENPKKQIPQAIIIAGIVIASVYIFSAFGIGVAIPSNEISTSAGMIDSLQIITGQEDGPFITVMTLLFLVTLCGNMISWAIGVNSVACYAAKQGDMPSFFKKDNSETGIPTGVPIMNGIVATTVVLIAPFIPNEDLFWSFFALNLVMFLLAYVPVFPAFLKLRKIDPDTERPFRVSGSEGLLKVMAMMPMSMILISLAFIVVPFGFDAETLAETLPITVGAIIVMGIGEAFILKNQKKDLNEVTSKK